MRVRTMAGTAIFVLFASVGGVSADDVLIRNWKAAIDRVEETQRAGERLLSPQTLESVLIQTPEAKEDPYKLGELTDQRSKPVYYEKKKSTAVEVKKGVALDLDFKEGGLILKTKIAY